MGGNTWEYHVACLWVPTRCGLWDQRAGRTPGGGPLLVRDSPANGLVYAASFSMIFAQTPERVLVFGRILRFEFSLEDRHEEQVPSPDLHFVNPKEAPETSLQSTVVHGVDNHRVLVEYSLLRWHATHSRIFGGPSGYRAIESPSCWVAVPPTITKA